MYRIQTWQIFGTAIAILLIIDSLIFGRNHNPNVRGALKETALWIIAQILFGIHITTQFGMEYGIEYATSYIIEEIMSIDNLFLFVVIFSMFSIPNEYQHKVLFYGIIGAAVFRALFIFLGIEFLSRCDFAIYIFGLLLIFAAVRTMSNKNDHHENMYITRLIHKDKTQNPHRNRFFLKIDKKNVLIPILTCMIIIELTDIIFALDSISAVLAVSTDMLVVYTSNIFAILGLRSLYFLVRDGLLSLRYLKYGLGIILLFIASKLLLSSYLELPVLISLTIIVGILLVTILMSISFSKKET